MRDSGTNDTDTLDALFEVLADQRRRYALYCLKKFEAPLALADLAEEVAVQEKESPITEISAKEVKRIYMSLYHNHIPKMEDYNVVSYDQETDAVKPSENSNRLEEILNILGQNDIFTIKNGNQQQVNAENIQPQYNNI